MASLLLVGFLSACTPSDTSPLKINDLFTDGMVLQQSSQVHIWGKAGKNQKITIHGSWEADAQTKADAEGNWSATIATPTAGGPYNLEISTRQEILTITDILIGEVWLASGQSNMEMPLKGWPPTDTILHSAQEIKQANHPTIRMFTVTRNYTIDPIDSIQGSWITASPETAADFSATAYFFAVRLQKELDVPIGIIHSSWGGTVAEAWTSEEKLRTMGDFDQALDLINDPALAGEMEEWFGPLTEMAIPETEEEWNNVDFADEAFLNDNVDEAIFEKVELPGAIDQFETGAYDGVVWIKKKITIDDPSQSYTLKIGSIDDMDATFINGQKVGGYQVPGFWNAERSFEIPQGLLREGENIISIRIIDTGGGGSVSGPMELMATGGKTISLEGEWLIRTIAEIKDGKFYLYPMDTDFSKRPDIRQLGPNTPSVLFNAMIHPLIPYQIAGAIWYQGESNVGRAKQYQTLFPAMITDWRTRWTYDFPFYFVQIAPYNYGNDLSPALRDAQRLSQSTPNTGMVVTLDIGNANNIHPGNKQDVGSRLAGLALKNTYGKEVIASGPLPDQVTEQDGALVITFSHVGEGLFSSDKTLSGFEIAGEDKNFVPASAKIEGSTVVVSSPQVAAPKYARYAYKDISIASLFGKNGTGGLPASSFSTENLTEIN